MNKKDVLGNKALKDSHAGNKNVQIGIDDVTANVEHSANSIITESIRRGTSKGAARPRKYIEILANLGKLINLHSKICKTLPTPGLEPGPHWDVVLSHACLPIPSRGRTLIKCSVSN